MRTFALVSSTVLSLGLLTAVPAEARPFGGYHRGHAHFGGHGFRHAGWRGGFNHGYRRIGWRGGYGYRRVGWRGYGYGYRRRGVGLGLLAGITGLAVGSALAANSYGYGYPAYSYPAYSYPAYGGYSWGGPVNVGYRYVPSYGYGYYGYGY